MIEMTTKQVIEILDDEIKNTQKKVNQGGIVSLLDFSKATARVDGIKQARDRIEKESK